MNLIQKIITFLDKSKSILKHFMKKLITICITLLCGSIQAQCYKYISSGFNGSFAIQNDGTLWGWGGNNYGQLGNGSAAWTTQNAPLQIGTDTTWESVSVAYGHTISLKSSGTLWAWGWNASGQLGDSTTTDKLTPIQIGTDTNWMLISTKNVHNLALKINGTLWSWGEGTSGCLGNGGVANVNTPTQVNGDMDWQSINTGLLNSFAIKTNGTLWAWGENTNGELGDGTNIDKLVPIQIGSDNNWKSIKTGYDYTIGLKTDGTLWAWGKNTYGQLGNGTNTDTTSPIQIGTDTDWDIVESGWFHTVAIKTNGTLWAWGYNVYGQLGDGTTVDKNLPTQIGTSADWESISLGQYHTVALKTNNTIWSWGYNLESALGDGTTTNSNTPIKVGSSNCSIPPVESVNCGNTFIKEFNGLGTTPPRLFKHPSGDFYIASTVSNKIVLSRVDPNGLILWTKAITLTYGVGEVVDLIIDSSDQKIVGIVSGSGGQNNSFKFDESTLTIDWVAGYSLNYSLLNIHETDNLHYVVTGVAAGGNTYIMQINQSDGRIASYQNIGFGGEFYSNFSGGNVYGGSRYYYNSSSFFAPALYKYDASTGTNIWTKTYIKATANCRIYTVAPIVDSGSMVQLSAGNDTNFNTYVNSTNKVWLLKTDLNGVLNWTKQITITGYNRLDVRKIVNTANGYYLIIDSYNGTFKDYFIVVKTDKNGVVEWANRYGNGGTNSASNAIENNGYLYITAISGSFGSGDKVVFMKLNTLGFTDLSCSYITPLTASSVTIPNVELNVTPNTPVIGDNYNPLTGSSVQNISYSEVVHCSSACPKPLPCYGDNTINLMSGLLAYYPFGEGSINDISGNGHHLTNTTTAHPTVDRNGNANCAFEFDRTNNEFLNLPSPNTFNTASNGPFSVSLWYKPTGSRGIADREILIGNEQMPICNATTGNWGLQLYDCKNTFFIKNHNENWDSSITTACDANFTGINDIWHHLVATFDGSTMRIYRNEILSSVVYADYCSSNINTLVKDVFIGKDFTGSLDNIFIYNKTLNSTEINQLFNLGSSCCSDNILAVNATINATTPLKDNIVISPNPTYGSISVETELIVETLRIYDINGRLIKSQSGSKDIDISELQSGLYFIKINTKSGVFTNKVIKK